MRKFILLVVLCALTSAASAAVPTSESIDTLLDATHTRRVLDEMLVTIDGMMKRGLAASGQPQTPEQQRAAELMGRKVAVIFREEMSWAKLEPLYVQVYQETYTQEEIDGLIAFYRTPVGAAYVDKLPIVLRRTVAATQVLMGPMGPRLQAAMKEATEEAKAETREQAKAGERD